MRKIRRRGPLGRVKWLERKAFYSEVSELQDIPPFLWVCVVEAQPTGLEREQRVKGEARRGGVGPDSDIM